jgi:radical SAM protein with 4Fe4S-binding SPASM domain
MNIIDIRSLRSCQTQEVETIKDTLRTVELNVVEICNRVCSFCPRNLETGYPNSNFRMSLDVVERIVDSLVVYGFKNRISIVGFGEPFLYKELVNAVSIIKKKIPDLKWLEIITNGDFLDREILISLSNAGCNQLTVSMYDSDISSKIKELVGSLNISLTFKHCYEDNFELNLINRSDIFLKKESVNYTNKCYLPFYKMFIDHNGNVLTCNNDWNKTGIVGNIFNETLDEIWFGDKLNKYRKKLSKGLRKDLAPCKFCDITGTVFGEQSYNTFLKTGFTDD